MTRSRKSTSGDRKRIAPAGDDRPVDRSAARSSLGDDRTLPKSKGPEPQFPVRLTEAQRKVIAELVPEFCEQLKLDQRDQRTISFTLPELMAIRRKVGPAIPRATSGLKRNSLKFALDFINEAIEELHGIGAIPPSRRIHQFKLTLVDTQPPIWRRIQVRECTLDKLHEHIQTAMGWTNSHLNQFLIRDQLYGDPLLMKETFAELNYQDSTTTKIGEILPRSGERFRFEYEYDFGDSWKHEILFEGCLRAEPGRRYPLCVEGERACPPEDVGGIWGYRDFLETLADPDDVGHVDLLNWAGGRFDHEAFDPMKATRRMRRGLPDWRSMP
jgi:hypothetical protein